MVAVPRLVIAAPSSGSGKTTVACGLMAALRATGLVVSGHKVGPDYIDPGYHSLATGRPARNLDPALCGARRIAPLFLHGARGADVAVVEGVMGLFDGATAPTGEGAGDPGFSSTAHVAGLLGAPVVLVIDASAAGRSVAAVATGFDRFDPGTTVAGVILNQVGSDRHEQLLRDALAAAGFPVFGAIRRSDEVSAPSRHLGLIPVGGTLGRRHRGHRPPRGPDRRLLRPARPAGPGPQRARPARPGLGPARAPAPGRAPGRSRGRRGRLHLLLHRAQRAADRRRPDVIPFDPLRDEALPAGTAGLVLGGGFPEMHASDLSANEPLRRRRRGRRRPRHPGRRRVRRAALPGPDPGRRRPCAASSPSTPP